MGKEVAGTLAQWLGWGEKGRETRQEVGGEAGAIPSYTIKKHTKTHVAILITKHALSSTSKHLPPYPYKP
jgi:hypothetical protein